MAAGAVGTRCCCGFGCFVVGRLLTNAYSCNLEKSVLWYRVAGGMEARGTGGAVRLR